MLSCCRHPFFRKNLPLELQTLMRDQGTAFAASIVQQPQQSLQDLMLVLTAVRACYVGHVRVTHAICICSQPSLVLLKVRRTSIWTSTGAKRGTHQATGSSAALMTR
jgi:hypothetical protein